MRTADALPGPAPIGAETARRGLRASLRNLLAASRHVGATLGRGRPCRPAVASSLAPVLLFPERMRATRAPSAPHERLDL